MINLTLVEITPDFCVEVEGKYLVKTRCPNPGLPNNRLADNFRILEAHVSRHFNEKVQKWEMKIGVNNQTPTHISILPITEYYNVI